MSANVSPFPIREDDGTFKKGVSGNPAGRPKGSKNAITLLKQSLELQLREQAHPQMSAVLEKAIELALEGNTNMIKLLLELHMSKNTSEEREAKEKVQITINSDRPPQISPVIEGQYEDVTDQPE